MSDFFDKMVRYFQKFFLNMERSENLEKICHNSAQKITFPRRFDGKNAPFEILINLIRKACFQMTLNARKS